MSTLCIESIGDDDLAEKPLLVTLLKNILCISRGTHAYDFILARLNDRVDLPSAISSKCILRNSAVKLVPSFNYKIPINSYFFDSQFLSGITKSIIITIHTLEEIKQLESHIWDIMDRFNINTFEAVTKLKFEIMTIELEIRHLQKELDLKKKRSNTIFIHSV